MRSSTAVCIGRTGIASPTPGSMRTSCVASRPMIPAGMPCNRRSRDVALTDEAILRIKKMIVSGQLKPGERLPREADLAETLGLSRISLREAVRALALINILDVRKADGTYVTSLDPNLLLYAL